MYALLALARRAEAAGAALELVVLGPCTNFAMALGRDPALARRLARVVLMGGCGDAHGNASPTTEFNIAADPEAAAAVFRAAADRTAASGPSAPADEPWLEVVSWELTKASSMPWERFDFMVGGPHAQRADNPVGNPSRVLAAASAGPFVKERRSDDPGAVICDAVAMAVALDPTILQSARRVHVDVELHGTLTRGQTVVDWGCFDGVERRPNCAWVTAVDVGRFSQLLETAVIPDLPRDGRCSE